MVSPCNLFTDALKYKTVHMIQIVCRRTVACLSNQYSVSNSITRLRNNKNTIAVIKSFAIIILLNDRWHTSNFVLQNALLISVYIGAKVTTDILFGWLRCRAKTMLLSITMWIYCIIECYEPQCLISISNLCKARNSLTWQRLSWL